jgi:hypothetical protein
MNKGMPLYCADVDRQAALDDGSATSLAAWDVLGHLIVYSKRSWLWGMACGYG